MDNKFAAINALEAAREALREAQVLLADAEHRLLDEWVDEAGDEVMTHEAEPMDMACIHDDPPSWPVPRSTPHS